MPVRPAPGVLVLLLLVAVTVSGCAFDPDGQVTVFKPGQFYPGNTLFNVSNYVETQVAYLQLLDPEGNRLWQFYNPYIWLILEYELTPDEMILLIPGRGLPAYRMDPASMQMEWSQWQVWTHHDIDVLPNGNYLCLYLYMYEGPPEMEYSPREADGVRIIDPTTNQVLWDWQIHEYIPHDEYCELCISQPQFFFDGHDWTHCNTVIYRREGGEDYIYLNVRNLNRLMKIHVATKEVVWTMGDGGDFGEGLWSHSHDPEFLPNGNILMLDNGLHRDGQPSGGYSRAIEIAFDPDAKYAEIVWEYRETPDFYTNVMGDADGLPNGNVLITDAVNGRILEVSQDKEKVWEFKLNTPFNWIYKAERVPWEGPVQQ
jgi:hypothetical protein